MYDPNNSSKGPEFGPQNPAGQIPSGSSIAGTRQEIRFNDLTSSALDKVRESLKRAIPNNTPDAINKTASEAIHGDINMPSEQK